jgi:hypothetical protein
MIQSTIHKLQYSLDVIQDEARHLVHDGVLSRQQPIYTLCQFIPPTSSVLRNGTMTKVSSPSPAVLGN